MTLSLGVFSHINLYEIITCIWSKIWYNQLNPILLLILTLTVRLSLPWDTSVPIGRIFMKSDMYFLKIC